VIRRVARVGAVLLVCGVAVGCATRADLLEQDRRVRGMIAQQKKDLDQVKRELERIRADLDEGGGRRGKASDDRISALEQRIAAMEHPSTTPPPPPDATTPPGETPPPDAVPPPEPPAETAARTTPPPPPPPPDTSDEWRREVAQEQAAVGTLNVPEKAEYEGILDGLAKKDCAKAVPQLNSMAANRKGSPLADNALYWAARCYAAKGDQNQAISKFYDVVTRYPKSDKAPTSLWLQGNLFLQIGDTPDARLALAKLIRDYPNSAEAAKARQKLSELEQ
jgi:tol-pal system protein YbgF